MNPQNIRWWLLRVSSTPNFGLQILQRLRIVFIHLNVFNTIFCVPRVVGQHGKIVPTLLSTHNLDLQCSHFKMTMIHNFEVVMHDQDNSLNPITGFGINSLHFPSSTISFQNTWSYRKLSLSKCLVLLKMNTCSKCSTSWNINCIINWVCTWIYAFDL